MMPDPVVQVKALRTALELALESHPTTELRMAMFKVSLSFDTKPTAEALESLVRLCSVELSQMALAEAAKPATVLKKFEKGATEKGHCGLWGTPEGCSYGTNWCFVSRQSDK